MSKIRINELARELEVKPSVILDMLPELGVAEKKTHSSSLDDDVALEIRRRVTAGSFEEAAAPAAKTEAPAGHEAPAALATHEPLRPAAKAEPAPAQTPAAPVQEVPVAPARSAFPLRPQIGRAHV